MSFKGGKWMVTIYNHTCRVFLFNLRLYCFFGIHVASEGDVETLRKMDSTGYGSITISEFEKLFEDEDMQARNQIFSETKKSTEKEKGLFCFWGFGVSGNPQIEKCLWCLIFGVATLAWKVFFLVCILYRASSLAPTNCPHLRLEFCVASNRLVVFDILQPDVYLVYTHGIKMTQNEVMTYYMRSSRRHKHSTNPFSRKPEVLEPIFGNDWVSCVTQWELHGPK